MAAKLSGSGGGKYTVEANAEINVTPFVDIMLVLLIIFMVSSSAAIESGLDVSLPEVNAVSDKSDAILVVSLSKTGEVAIQGNKILPDEIKDKIAAEMLIDENATEYSLNIAKEIIFNTDSQIKTFKVNTENLAKEVALYKLM